MKRKTARSAGKSQKLIFKYRKSGNKTNIFDINHYLGNYNTHTKIAQDIPLFDNNNKQ